MQTREGQNETLNLKNRHLCFNHYFLIQSEFRLAHSLCVSVSITIALKCHYHYRAKTHYRSSLLIVRPAITQPVSQRCYSTTSFPLLLFKHQLLTLAIPPPASQSCYSPTRIPRTDQYQFITHCSLILYFLSSIAGIAISFILITLCILGRTGLLFLIRYCIACTLQLNNCIKETKAFHSVCQLHDFIDKQAWTKLCQGIMLILHQGC